MEATTRDRINKVIDKILLIEQGFSNHPSDRGKKTRWGITEFIARSYGWKGPMEELPITLAREIFFNRFVVTPKFDLVLAIDEEVGFELIDTGVNKGPGTASEYLQRWLNGFNYRGRYDDLFVDGRIGPASLDALDKFLSWRGERGRVALLTGLNCIQGSHYLAITESDKSQRDFLFGWILNRVVAV